MAQIILWNSFDFARHTIVRPLGVHQLASWLTSHGYSVKVIDFCSVLSTSDLISVTKNFIDSDTIAIGVTNNFWDDDQVLLTEPKWVVKARGFLENLFPNLDWLLGGSRNSYLKLDLKLKWKSFTGYSEDNLLKYIDTKTKSLKFRTPFNIQENKGHWLDKLYIQSSEVLPIELSRGCQFKCRFCRFAELGKKKNTYIRDYGLMKEEFLSNYERFGVTRYMVMDDTANESIEKVEALAKIAQELPFKLEWIGYIRLDLIGTRPATADLLVESGLRGCYFGIESFHPEASLIVGKGWNGKHAKDMLLKLNEQWKDKVAYEVGLIAGLNGETEKDLDETQKWCFDNNIYSWRWTALSISRQPVQLWKSEFDVEYEKYGYRFPPNENYNWESDDWTYKRAFAKTQQLNEERREHVFLNPWHAGTVASLGYNLDDLFKTKAHLLNYDELNQKTKDFLKNYVQYLKTS